MDLLFWMAVIPPLFLLYKVYKMDSVEKEPPKLILKLLLAGALTTIPAGLLEMALGYLYGGIANAFLVALIENFLVVAVVEEGVKYFALKKVTWQNPEFNFTFDGVVYAVTVSLGFALAENIEYVAMYGFATAVVRAFTAIILHGVCGVFLGIYYGGAKKLSLAGDAAGSSKMIRRGYLTVVFIHGLYDFCASMDAAIYLVIFYAFLIFLYVVTYRKLKEVQRQDSPVSGPFSF